MLVHTKQILIKCSSNIPGNSQKNKSSYLMKMKYDESCFQLRPFCHFISIQYSFSSVITKDGAWICERIIIHSSL